MTRPFVVACVLAALAAHARAQDSGENKAAAAAAFDQGKQLIAAGKVADACTQFAKSEQLDPQFGTQYNLALCNEQLGKLASAYGDFDELASKDTNARRRADSKAHAARLKPRLTSLTLIVHDPAPDLKITRDGDDITVLVGVTTPVDPGKFRFEASAPGYQTWSQDVDLSAEGATITVEIPALQKESATSDDTTEPDHVAVHPAVAKHGGKSGGGGRKILGLSIGGAGLVAAGVGLFFGSQAMSLTSDAKKACGGDTLDPCNGNIAQARTDIADAKSKATLSNIFVGAGVAALGAGIFLWLTAPSRHAEEHAALVPVIDAHGAGLALDGAF